MDPMVRPRIPFPAAWIALLLAAASPPASAQDPAPPAPAPAPSPAPGPTPPPADDVPDEPAATRGPLTTIEQAYKRLTALREAPLGGPGSWPRRMNRIRKLADQALALHAATPAAGEDLYRLAEICIDAERFAEAAGFAERYLGGAGKEPLPSLGPAHALRVRALARMGKVADAEAALKAYREALPKAEGLGPVTKHFADALAAAGRVEDALARYRESCDLLPRPLPALAAGVYQSLAETLVALGRAAEARKAIETALGETKEPLVVQRLQAVRRRLDLVGKPFAPPPFDRWVGGDGPTPASLKGKVVVWHFYAWWMDARKGQLDDWRGLLAEGAAKGLEVVPVTHTGGWDPAKERIEKGRAPGVESADIATALKSRGWTGPAGVYFGEMAFGNLQIRGLPMEVVVGRDGNVRMVQAGGDAGHALALRAAALALAEPPPAAPAPGTPPGGDPPAAPPKEPPPPAGK
jgi:tetratricopeptide (TPR) repeat protein